jgi:hypothetical protein
MLIKVAFPCLGAAEKRQQCGSNADYPQQIGVGFIQHGTPSSWPLTGKPHSWHTPEPEFPF